MTESKLELYAVSFQCHNMHFYIFLSFLHLGGLKIPRNQPQAWPQWGAKISKWPSQQPLGAMSRDDLLEQLRGIGMPCVLGGASAERCD
jgi:hypothetical protein